MKNEIKKWKVKYYEDTDTLFVSREKIPKDAELYMINPGYSCCVTKKGKVVGIMIEYFKTETQNKYKIICN